MLSGSYSSAAVGSYGASSLGLSTFFGNVAKAEQTLNTGLSGGMDTLFSTEGSRAMLNAGPMAGLMGFGRFGNAAGYTGGMGAGMGAAGVPGGAGVMVGGPPPGVVGAGVSQAPLQFGNPTPQPGQVFGPNAFAGWQGSGAGAAGGAGGGMNVNASSRSSKSDRISQEMREKAIDRVQAKGYSAEDAQSIVDRAEKASSGEQRSFHEILNELPERPKTFEDKKDAQNKVTESAQQQRQKWVRDFGNWQARYLENVDRKSETSEARQQLVSDAASQGGARYEFKRKPDATSRGLGYEVVRAEGQTEVNARERVYFNPQDKQWYKDAALTQVLTLPGTADASRKPETISVGGGSSFLTVVPDGAKPSRGTKAEGNHQVMDRYRLEGVPTESVAAERYQQTMVEDGQRYAYYNPDRKEWLIKDTQGKPQVLQGARYQNGRLYLSSSDAVNPQAASNVSEYMGRLATAGTDYRERTARVAPLERSQREDRAKKVQEELNATIGEKASSLTYAYDAEAGVLKITCPADKASEVEQAMKADDAKIAARGNSVLRDLPDGTRISVNDSPSFTAGAGAYQRIRDEVKKTPAETKPADQSVASQPAANQPAVVMTESQRQLLADLDTKAQSLEAAARSYQTALNSRNPGIRTSTKQNYDRAFAAYGEALAKANTEATKITAEADRTAYQRSIQPHQTYHDGMRNVKSDGQLPARPVVSQTVVNHSEQQSAAASSMPDTSAAANTARKNAREELIRARNAATAAMSAADEAVQSKAKDRLEKVSQAQVALGALEGRIKNLEQVLGKYGDLQNENLTGYIASCTTILTANRQSWDRLRQSALNA